jgi:glucose dehydrogenase
MNEKRVPSDQWNGMSPSTHEFSKNNIQTGRRQTVAPRKLLLVAVAAVFSLGAAVYFAVLAAPAEKKNVEWPRYGHDLANSRFQNADQINSSNAGKLRVAWVFNTGVLDPQAELETSPIEVGGTLFITDGHDDVFALDATTGGQKWAYKPTQIPGEMPP